MHMGGGKLEKNPYGIRDRTIHKINSVHLSPKSGIGPLSQWPALSLRGHPFLNTAKQSFFSRGLWAKKIKHFREIVISHIGSKGENKWIKVTCIPPS